MSFGRKGIAQIERTIWETPERERLSGSRQPLTVNLIQIAAWQTILSASRNSTRSRELSAKINTQFEHMTSS
jgi:hypothetical protein